MKTFWTILLVIVAVLAIIDGGKYLGMAILTVLAPIYALLLASIILIIFVITAAISVSIGNRVMDRREAAETPKKVVEQPRAA